LKAIQHICILLLAILTAFFSDAVHGQVSPGDLHADHARYEGLANCTKCHTVGKGVSDAKCLDCHKEILTLRNSNRGLHSQPNVRQKTCVSCHSDHHGRNFQMVRFDQKNFQHEQAGYRLEGAHRKLDCKECHKAGLIRNKTLAARRNTWLGLETSCLSCHQDTHQGTLKGNCLDCHTMEKFKPAERFNHESAKFKLRGAHVKTDCRECHRIEQRNGREFQQFTGLSFNTCTACHKDVHEGKFGQNCVKCHNEKSFKSVRIETASFDHDVTRYPLEGMHEGVECRKCHKTGSYTDPVRFGMCRDCHTDYHKGEFVRSKPSSDCKECHTLSQPFTSTTYSLEKHDASAFPLRGSHMATACNDCHIKDGRWTFRSIGTTCVDCHQDIHAGKISGKYYPASDCRVCHAEENWASIRFDHDRTGYRLTGKHALASCRDCHFGGTSVKAQVRHEQRFSGLTDECRECHADVHGRQFDQNGQTTCKACHTDTKTWKADRFRHDSTAFPLDGQHAQAACAACHKPQPDAQGRPVIIYKTKKTKCIDCHS